MDNEDRPTFVELIEGIGECYGKKLTDAMYELYWRALNDLSVAAVERACIEAVRQAAWFPKPAELRQFAFQHARERQPTTPGQLRLPSAPHNPRGQAMARGLAEIVALVDPAQRLEKLRELAVAYPGVGWEDAVAQAEQQRASA